MNLALIQSALVFALVIYLLLPIGKLGFRARLLALTTLLVCSLIPIDGLPLVFYWRALLDDLAITTLVLLVVGAARHTLQPSAAKQTATNAAPKRIAPLMFLAVLGDRKSTRLNSSHVKISYAVFCLKKKITK